MQFVIICIFFGAVLATLDVIHKRVKNMERILDSLEDDDVRKAIVNSLLKDCEQLNFGGKEMSDFLIRMFTPQPIFSNDELFIVCGLMFAVTICILIYRLFNQ